MHFFAILAIALVSSISGTLAQSSLPGCATCPAEDGLDFALGVSNTQTDPIFCSYPAVENEDPNDFYCTYNKVTGVLVTDNDAGLCPPTTSTNCANVRRRNALPRSPYPPTANARAEKPQMMQTRRKLGVSKRREVN